MRVNARDGDTLEKIAYRYLGNNANIEAVIAINHHLAQKIFLQKGDRVILPESRANLPVKEIIQLWS